MRVGVLTISDSVSRGAAEDRSGLSICDDLRSWDASVEITRATIPDETHQIVATLIEWVDKVGLDVILTTGGTGLGPRDVTPEATLEVITHRIAGIEEAIRAQGRAKLALAVLSRGVAGFRNQTLVVNLPGSPSGAREGVEVVSPILKHAVDLLHGNTRHDHTAGAAG